MEYAWHHLEDLLGSKLAYIKSELEVHYNESHRHYHTLTHIDDMLTILMNFTDVINDVKSIYLATLFHDVIYNPQSSTNEEDSAALFETLCGDLLPNEMLVKVKKYIIETKAHKVHNSDDNDLKLFIDADMSILGREPVVYQQYCAHIRLEYQHVSDDIYCTKRAAFLRSCLDDTTPIFASPQFAGLYGAQARVNLAWECSLLEAGRLDVIMQSLRVVRDEHFF